MFLNDFEQDECKYLLNQRPRTKFSSFYVGYKPATSEWSSIISTNPLLILRSRRKRPVNLLTLDESG